VIILTTKLYDKVKTVSLTLSMCINSSKQKYVKLDKDLHLLMF